MQPLATCDSTSFALHSTWAIWFCLTRGLSNLKKMQWTLWVKTGDCLDLKAPSQHKLSRLGLESLEAHTRSTVNACSCVSKGSHWKVACTRQEVGIGPDQTWKHTKTCGVCSSCQMLSENGRKINIQRSAHISHTHIYILHPRLSSNAHLYHFTMSGHPFFWMKAMVSLLFSSLVTSPLWRPTFGPVAPRKSQGPPAINATIGHGDDRGMGWNHQELGKTHGTRNGATHPHQRDLLKKWTFHKGKPV